MVVNLSLSIFVDGSIVSEVMVIIDKVHERKICCYPCNTNVDTTIALHELATELVKKRVLCTINCYIALIMRKNGILTIPINDDRTINFHIALPLLYRRVAEELISTLNTLLKAT